MQAEWIFTGGPVLSPHLQWRPAGAVAVAAGRILAVGSEADVLHVAGPGTRVVQLEGRAVLPGLIDAHIHLLGYAISLDRLAVAGLGSLAAMREAVARECRGRPAGSWISGRGWDQDRWPERREPTRHDLDLVSPDHPVYLQRNCNHVAVVNSVALRLAGITRETPDPPGGQIDRDPRTGEPTGMLRENAQALVSRVMEPMSHERKRLLLRQAVAEALRYGITQVHTDDVDRQAGSFDLAEDLFRSVSGPEALPFRVTQMIPMGMLQEADERGVRTGTGDPWYRYGQVKLFADGSLGGRTAALLAPYADDPSTTGLYIWPQDEFIEQVVRAHRLGNQVGVHCIGDGAAGLFIDAVAAAQRLHPRRDHRHRMIHCQILSEVQMDQMLELGILADIQPVFLKSDGHWYADRVGPERARSSYAWRSLLDRGIALCGGSDCPIEPLNIWYGIYAAVTRQDLDGFPAGGWDPDQRLSVAQTLELYTTGASYATFEEYFKGSLQPGMAADLVITDRNPFTCDPTELKAVTPHLTMVGGRIGYQA